MQIGIDGEKWIYTRRSKTNTPVRIPLLKEAEKILDRYKDHPKVERNEILLPVYSNQKTNQYLKGDNQKSKSEKETELSYRQAYFCYHCYAG